MNEPLTQTTDAVTTDTASIADTPATPQPSIDTSVPDDYSLYEPTLAKGKTHRLLCIVDDCGPSISPNDQTFGGWSFTLRTMVEAPDDSGGRLPIGTRFKVTIWTTQSQFRTAKDGADAAIGTLMGLNNIAINTRNRASCEAAMAAFRALEPAKRLPYYNQEDREQMHYDQWKNTQVVAVLQAKEKDNKINVNCFGLEAASTYKP